MSNPGLDYQPLLADGQAYGGIVPGIGQVLRERTVDADGQLLTSSHMDYAMPRAEDVPLFLHEVHSVRGATNPLGAKSWRKLERYASEPSFETVIVEENQRSPVYGGRSVFGWEGGQSGSTTKSVEASSARLCD